jgi:hypothetical protein
LASPSSNDWLETRVVPSPESYQLITPCFPFLRDKKTEQTTHHQPHITTAHHHHLLLRREVTPLLLFLSLFLTGRLFGYGIALNEALSITLFLKHSSSSSLSLDILSFLGRVRQSSGSLDSQR